MELNKQPRIHKMTDEQYNFVKLVYDYTFIAETLYKYSRPINNILESQGRYYTNEQRDILNMAGKDFINTYPNMDPINWKLKV